MLLALLAVLGGFAVLIWSADHFVNGAAATARHFGMPSLLVGMVIVGIGTSAPEMVVSAIAALDGSPALALGNALGSNIVNTGLVLGLTVLLVPLMVHSNIVKKELPLLIAISVLFGIFCWDGSLSLIESGILLFSFFALIAWSIFTGLRSKGDPLESEIEESLEGNDMSIKQAFFWLGAGLVLLIASSKVLVWGAVEIAHFFGVSDLIIGLTIVALGTSLPELAATISAARKGEHDIAIGNVVGSNMFNILAVVGIAGMIAPMDQLPSEIMNRDWPVMMLLTVSIFVMAFMMKKINRSHGIYLLSVYVAYNGWLIYSLAA